MPAVPLSFRRMSPCRFRALPWQARSRRDVVLGVRPQDLALAGAQEPASIRGRVWVVELLGSEKLVEVTWATGAG